MNKNKYIVVFFAIIILGIVFLVYNLSKKEKSSTTNPATVLLQSVINANSGTASAVLSGAKTVIWQTNNYPANAGVNINLIRKISDSPRQFTIVRTIAANTPNDGQETWMTQTGENSNDLYIEVTCSNSYQFKAGCNPLSDVLKVN